mmetsp:Transcript_8357/g.12123  ORF Transcript_8357/g.12123 Transcript_8357/m.12123 type:complete len:99 (+) Transcript_8357:234-530(+)
MCCSSNQAAFVWIGAIMVNIGFLSFVSWGAAPVWPVGFVLSALYTIFLLSLAQWLVKRQEGHTNVGGEAESNEAEIVSPLFQKMRMRILPIQVLELHQ